MKTIATPNAPSAIGPYSQAQVSGNLLFTAGQIPLVPGTMEMVTGSVEDQTVQVVANLTAVLQAAGTDWSRVLKTTVFLTDLAEFGAFNAVYEKLLGGAKPARSTVQVAALPRGAKVEIELVAEIRADA
ncbi:RidA family protein [Mesoterricola silvestris]|uniref:Reactive intermediate/imine deaminase n=1 Tax=Mesoterricola silvestris TaxID=2927979 RepID=A0AA48GRR6_9BACT|nr:RidA family protein [Mesoterricola silvestris]BDU74954.1 reactive intermediate/imine deaminase [Mesoterricola silvestris]